MLLETDKDKENPLIHAMFPVRAGVKLGHQQACTKILEEARKRSFLTVQHGRIMTFDDLYKILWDIAGE